MTTVKDRERKGRTSERKRERKGGRKKERKKERGEGRRSCHRLLGPSVAPFLPRYPQITPSLTSPTRAAFRKVRTASVFRSSESKSRIVVLLGLALACLTRKPKPLLLLGVLPPPSDAPLLPDASPTFFHSCLISFVHTVHSLKRCFLLCLPLLHHQHSSLSIQLCLSLRKGAITAWPPRS